VTAARFVLAALLLFLSPAAHAQAADTLSLGGDWRFKQGDDPAWAAAGLNDGGWRTMAVPSEWETTIGEYDGFGWYRREVVLPPSLRGAPVGVRFATVGDAFEVFWNGVRVGGSGRMPPNFVEGALSVLIFVPDSLLSRAAGGRHVLAVRVFNDYAYGGVMGSVRVGRYDVLAQQRSPRPVVIGGLVSFFLAIGVYHLAFFLRRRAARENLWFAGVCLAVSVYGATYADEVGQAVMPWINPYRLGVLAMLAGGPFFVALIDELFGLRGARHTRRVTTVLAACFGATLALPLRMLAELVLWMDAAIAVGLMVIVWRAWRMGRKGTAHAGTLLFGTAAFSGTMLYDVLSEYSSLVPVARLLPGTPSAFWVGFLVFVVTVGIATAGRWALTEVTALTDPMTGLSRRHVLEDALRREAERVRRTGGSLALVLIDLDHFKRVNDTHGHRVGDLVLERVGRLLRATTRNLDLPSRFGGEEFAVLLYDTDLPGALSFAERFRGTLRDMRCEVAHGQTVRVTASVGVAVGTDLVDPQTLVELADQALYRAKNSGRDRLVSVTLDSAEHEFVAAR
jgi:diguanylate cyclase (GGDEF)-like protein